jgi:hypothetical protein
MTETAATLEPTTEAADETPDQVAPDDPPKSAAQRMMDRIHAQAKAEGWKAAESLEVNGAKHRYPTANWTHWPASWTFR